MARQGFVDLGQRGIDYVREHLTGVNPFCTALAAAVDAAAGRVLTLPPPGADMPRLLRFSEGGLLAANNDFSRMKRLEDGSGLMPVETLKIEQAAYLTSLLRAAPEAVCILDDFNPSWSEYLSVGEYDIGPRAFSVDDAVYHLFTAEDPPGDLALKLTDADTIWHGVAAVCVDAPEIDEDRLCSVESLQFAAASVIALTCTAYDGEGFVVWRRE